MIPTTKYYCEILFTRKFKDILCSDTKYQFCKLWFQMLESERQIEILRQKLVFKIHFDFKNVFDWIDTDKDAFIRYDEIR